MPGPITRLLACDEEALRKCVRPAQRGTAQAPHARTRSRALLPPHVAATCATATATWTLCPRTCTPTLRGSTSRILATTTCRTISLAASSTGALHAPLLRCCGASPHSAAVRAARGAVSCAARVAAAEIKINHLTQLLIVVRLENTNVTADIVFFIDADMIFLRHAPRLLPVSLTAPCSQAPHTHNTRRPVTPSLVGVRRGRAVSAAYDYLIGVDDPDIVSRFLPEENRPLMRKVGGWTMMYVDDMRAVAPLWLSYTEAVRTAKFGNEIWHKMVCLRGGSFAPELARNSRTPSPPRAMRM